MSSATQTAGAQQNAAQSTGDYQHSSSGVVGSAAAGAVRKKGNSIQMTAEALSLAAQKRRQRKINRKSVKEAEEALAKMGMEDPDSE